MTCAYKGKANGSTIPECWPGGEIHYVVRGYWRGEMLRKVGPDMHLCEVHGPWLRSVNRFHKVERIDGPEAQ